MTVSLALIEGSLIGTAAWAAIHGWTSPPAGGWIGFGTALGPILAISLCCVVAFYYQELYDLRIARTFGCFLSRLPQSAGLALILTAASWAVLPDARLPARSLPPIALAIMALLVTLRAVVYGALALRPFARRVLILGNEALARRISDEIAARPGSRHAAVGLVAETADAPGAPAGSPVLGTLEDLDRIIRETRPDRIIVALEERRGRLPVRRLLEARVRGIVVEDGVEAYERLAGKIAIESQSPGALAFSPGFHASRLDRGLARAISFLAAVACLILFAPLLALCALIIKLDSRGPILFVHERAGLGGRRFRLLKFRTMNPAPGPRSEWAGDNGDRITRVGRWLRKYRLDELPQFVNILRGDMDLVGPRPHPASNVDLFAASVPYYWVRSLVRPGATGWAQIRYGYANGLEEETEKMRYDLYYIKHRSLALDLRILIDTIRIVLLGRGAGAARSSRSASPDRAGPVGLRWEFDPRRARRGLMTLGGPRPLLRLAEDARRHANQPGH